MVPLAIFGSRQFSGANLVTLFVYAALGATTFLLVVHLQEDLGYSALEAGAALLPITALMLVFSARSAGLAQRIGPRLPMTLGPLAHRRRPPGAGADQPRGQLRVRCPPGACSCSAWVSR